MSLLWNKLTVLLLATIFGALGVLLALPWFLFLAMLLVVWALLKAPDASALPAINLRTHLFPLVLIAALAASGWAAWQAARHNFQFYPQETAVWLASILAVALAALWHDSRLRRAASPAALDTAAQPLSRAEVVLMTFMTVGALALRVYDLPALPPMLHGDEGEVGMLALRVLHGPEPLPIFASTIFGHNPAGFPYLAAPLIAFFGRNEVGLRLLPALFGAAGVPFLYLIGRRGWGVAAGGMAAWLLAVSHFHIHYSRIAVPNIANATIVIVLVWVLFRAWHCNLQFAAPDSAPGAGETGRASLRFASLQWAVPLASFAGVGLVIGLGQYVYHGSRLLPMIAGFAFLVMLLKRKVTLLQLVVAVLAALVVILPLGTFYFHHWEEFVGRSQDVFIFRQSNLQHVMGAEATFANDLLPYLRHQFVTTLAFISGGGDRSSFYLADIAAFDPVTLVLVWLGFGAILVAIRRFEESVTAAWFVLGMLFAGFLTTEQPNGPRLVSVAPACYLIAGVFVHRLWMLLPVTASKRSRQVATAAAGGLALLLLYLNARTYFVDLKGYTHSILPTVVARAVAAAPESTTVYLAGDPILYAEHGAIRFLAGTDRVFNLKTADELPDPAQQDAGLLVLALEPSLGMLQEIEARYPGGVRHAFSDEKGRFLYASYALPERRP